MAELFEIEGAQSQLREVIKVIGVGGGGGNALNHIVRSGVTGVEFIAANTDVAHLSLSEADVKIVLGRELTKGLGAGADPEIGMRSAEESIDEIREVLIGADMIFLTAGMGGGTGTGASPVIAQVAKENGTLVVAVATKPFLFEGQRRITQALEGIENLRGNVDALIIIPVSYTHLDVYKRQIPLLAGFVLEGKGHRPSGVLRKITSWFDGVLKKVVTFYIELLKVCLLYTSSRPERRNPLSTASPAAPRRR